MPPAPGNDPAGPTTMYQSTFPDPTALLPPDILPRQVTLRDRQTVATVIPFTQSHLPASLLMYLCDQFNKEIEGGDTYPMIETFSLDAFVKYWFQNFGAVMLLGNIEGAEAVVEGKDWSKECLGSFYIKPNYPGRSSHVCDAGFLVTDASRNRGVGRLMGEAYLDWAPRLGYTYSVFNLVYETNVASCRIWDALGFKRIGRVKGCGNLKSYPGRYIDAIIYGRDLAPGESEELVSEERFDKIRFYLKYGKYPNVADRAEKSRLRSAATHYKLLEDDRLMLKDKEVIADPARQYDIAREVHVQHHGGINKTTATIAEKYHWSRIKETVSDVIRNCSECKDSGKTPNPGGARKTTTTQLTPAERPSIPSLSREPSSTNIDPSSRVLNLQDHSMIATLSQHSSTSSPGGVPYADPSEISILSSTTTTQPFHHPQSYHHMLQDQYQPIDPQIINNQSDYDYHAQEDFQALLNATEDEERARNEAVDRDLEMLIAQGDEDEDDDEDVDGGGVVVGREDMMIDGQGLGLGIQKNRGSGYDVGFGT